MPVHPDILADIDRAAGYLADAGYAIEDVPVPTILDAARAWMNVALFEVKTFLDPIARSSGSEQIKSAFDFLYRMSDMIDHTDYVASVASRTGLIRPWSEFLASYPLVLSPFSLLPTPDQGFDHTYEGAKAFFDGLIYSYGINYLGLPAGCVPIGLVEGRPSGVQIIGRRFREDLILDALEVIENRVGILTHKLWDGTVSDFD